MLGAETPITPEEPDVLDGGYGVEGLGVDRLAAVSSSYLPLTGGLALGYHNTV